MQGTVDDIVEHIRLEQHGIYAPQGAVSIEDILGVALGAGMEIRVTPTGSGRVTVRFVLPSTGRAVADVEVTRRREIIRCFEFHGRDEPGAPVTPEDMIYTLHRNYT